VNNAAINIQAQTSPEDLDISYLRCSHNGVKLDINKREKLENSQVWIINQQLLDNPVHQEDIRMEIKKYQEK
jgi:hypothetical protein